MPGTALHPVDPRAASDFVSLTRARALAHPDRLALAFYEPIGGGLDLTETDALTYGALDARARAIAVALGARCSAGDRALLLFPPGLDYIAALLGCMYAGVVPVPAYPPEPNRLQHTLPRVLAIIADADPGLILTTPAIRGMGEQMLSQVPALADREIGWMDMRSVDPAGADAWRPPALDRGAVAFLQYTSGSTSAPKGVVVTHGSLLANVSMMAEASGWLAHRCVCWVPLYHDLGLVAHTLQTLFLGGETALMSPIAFLKRPARWLRMITTFRATWTGAPNFAYDLCARKVTPAELAQLDLSSLTELGNGGEPVVDETMRRFRDTFSSAGLPATALSPTLGMAEATVFATISAPAQRCMRLAVERAALEQLRIVPARPGAAGSLTLVSSGRAWCGAEVAIVDPETGLRAPPDRVGEIWIAGDHLAAGYWRRPEASARTFGNRLAGDDRAWLRSGDLGLLHRGELFVTGRLKETLILRGRNLFPHDIERLVAAQRSRHPSIRPGCAAAYGIEREGREQLALCVEVDPRRDPGFDAAETARAIREAVAEAFQVGARSILLVAPGALPKTSSGKIMRLACGRDHDTGYGDAELFRSDARAPIAAEISAPPPASSPAPPPAPPMERWVLDWIAREIGIPVDEIDPGEEFAAYGVDSVSAVQFVADSKDAFGISLPEDALWDHRTPRALASYLGALSAGVAPIG